MREKFRAVARNILLPVAGLGSGIVAYRLIVTHASDNEFVRGLCFGGLVSAGVATGIALWSLHKKRRSSPSSPSL